MMRAVGRRVDEVLPNGWLDAGFQFLLFILAYNAYQLVRGITDSGAVAAYVHAEQIIGIEKSLGTFFEAGFQDALLNHASWLVDVANFTYLNSHFVVTTGFLAWLYLARNEHFYFVRNMFMVAMAIALVGYALYPTAPPRLFPGEGFTDTIAQFTGGAQDSQTASLLVNKYAAVPSMHMAFSLMVAASAFALVRQRTIKALWALYPPLVFFAIVATGNHFWLDAAAGAAVAGTAGAVALQLGRLRPAAWAWREA